MIILIAVLGLVVVNAMKQSTWATSTVAATVPIAMLVGIYMTHLRPGRLVEASVLGVDADPCGGVRRALRRGV